MECTQRSRRRLGLEQEFFLTDQTGVLCAEADRFVLRCRESAASSGGDPGCFRGECARSMVEVSTAPCHDFAALAEDYESNLRLALHAGRELGLRLYPLGTYPLPTNPIFRDEPCYTVKKRTLGGERMIHAGRCAGTHLHLELPPNTVAPTVKASRRASPEAREELLALYNLATALDPALVALGRSCPFYEGEMPGFAARVVRYRGALDVKGVYSGLPEIGDLQPYAGSVEDLISLERRRYQAWFSAMDRAGVERRLFGRTGGNRHRAAWNPVRLSPHGTVEIRTPDSNYPDKVLALAALIYRAARRVRREGLRVLPLAGVRVFEAASGMLLVPDLAYLRGELFPAAATTGTGSPEVRRYLDSIFEFAESGTEGQEYLERLRNPGGGYAVTEAEILRRSPPVIGSIAPGEGLELVREACDELERQILRPHPGNRPDPLSGDVTRRYSGEPGACAV